MVLVSTRARVLPLRDVMVATLVSSKDLAATVLTVALVVTLVGTAVLLVMAAMRPHSALKPHVLVAWVVALVDSAMAAPAAWVHWVQSVALVVMADSCKVMVEPAAPAA